MTFSNPQLANLEFASWGLTKTRKKNQRKQLMNIWQQNVLIDVQIQKLIFFDYTEKNNL